MRSPVAACLAYTAHGRSVKNRYIPDPYTCATQCSCKLVLSLQVINYASAFFHCFETKNAAAEWLKFYGVSQQLIDESVVLSPPATMVGVAVPSSSSQPRSGAQSQAQACGTPVIRDDPLNLWLSSQHSSLIIHKFISTQCPFPLAYHVVGRRGSRAPVRQRGRPARSTCSRTAYRPGSSND